MGKSAPSPPPPPDYTGAAVAQGQANKEAALATGVLNNPNIVGPTGTQTTTFANDPTTGNPQPTVTQTLSPEQQALYEQGVKTKGLLGGLGEQGATALQGVVGKPLDFSGAPAAPQSGQVNQSVIDAMMGRVNEDYAKATDQKNSDLVAAGIRPGSKAYGDSMQLLQRGRNDAAQQATLAGYQQGGQQFTQQEQARKDAIAETLSQRGIPLNEITALMSGSQVSNPFATAPAYNGGASVAPAPLFGATNLAGQYGTDVYNQQVGTQNANTSGLFGLGGTALMAGGLAV